METKGRDRVPRRADEHLEQEAQVRFSCSLRIETELLQSEHCKRFIASNAAPSDKEYIQNHGTRYSMVDSRGRFQIFHYGIDRY